MATTSHIIFSTSLTFSSPHKPSILPQPPSFFNLHTKCSTKFHNQLFNINLHNKLTKLNAVLPTSKSSPVSSSSTSSNFYGVCYVVRDDVDTDQIIPSTYSTLNPSNPDEYNDIGLHAFVGLPTSYALRFMEENGVKSKYSVIIAGKNFGCGSSKEHAIVALNAAGVRAVVAESYDEDYLKNLESNGRFLAFESEVRICEEFKTGDVATIDVDEKYLINQTTGKVFELKPFVDVDTTREVVVVENEVTTDKNCNMTRTRHKISGVGLAFPIR